MRGAGHRRLTGIARIVFVPLLGVFTAAAVPEGTPSRPKAGSGGFISGHLLVAAPNAVDPRFARTVVLMVRHNSRGSFGLIVNRVAGKINAADLLKKLGDAPHAGDTPSGDISVHVGGPVAAGRAFVIHSSEFRGKATMAVNRHVAVTTSPDVLRAMATGKGPRNSILALGYAGWGPGQLERELGRKWWVVAPFDGAVVFDRHIDTKWRRALARRGMDL